MESISGLMDAALGGAMIASPVSLSQSTCGLSRRPRRAHSPSHTVRSKLSVSNTESQGSHPWRFVSSECSQQETKAADRRACQAGQGSSTPCALKRPYLTFPTFFLKDARNYLQSVTAVTVYGNWSK